MTYLTNFMGGWLLALIVLHLTCRAKGEKLDDVHFFGSALGAAIYTGATYLADKGIL